MNLEEALALPSSSTRVLIFGLPGTGKSTLAAELSNYYNLIWITLDNDIDILRKLSPAQIARVNVINIPDSAAFPVAADTLMQLFKQQKGKICYAHGKYGCSICTKSAPTKFTAIDFTTLPNSSIVIIDTGTQLGRSILAHTTKDKPVDYKPERDDWGALRKYTEFFASQFQAARFNLIVICHAVEAELEDEKKKLVTDFGSKGMSATFAKAFSHVIYTDVVNKKHRAYSKSTHSNNILTKSRTDFAIEELKEPSLESIFRFSEPLPNPEGASKDQETVESKEPNKAIEKSPAPTPAQHAVVQLTAMQERLARLSKK